MPNIQIQIAVWPQSEGFSRNILGGHVAFVTVAFYVCPLQLRSILGVTHHSFWIKTFDKCGYFKLNLSKCFSNKYCNIQEWEYESILDMYVRCMWVIWKMVGLWFRRNFSNICGIFVYVILTAMMLAVPRHTNIGRPMKKDPNTTDHLALGWVDNWRKWAVDSFLSIYIFDLRLTLNQCLL